MAFRYRVVVLIFVLLLAPAAFAGHPFGPVDGVPPQWGTFWAIELIGGSIIAALWLLACWVVSPRVEHRP